MCTPFFCNKRSVVWWPQAHYMQARPVHSGKQKDRKWAREVELRLPSAILGCFYIRNATLRANRWWGEGWISGSRLFSTWVLNLMQMNACRTRRYWHSEWRHDHCISFTENHYITLSTCLRFVSPAHLYVEKERVLQIRSGRAKAKNRRQ